MQPINVYVVCVHSHYASRRGTRNASTHVRVVPHVGEAWALRVHTRREGHGWLKYDKTIGFSYDDNCPPTSLRI